MCLCVYIYICVFVCVFYVCLFMYVFINIYVLNELNNYCKMWSFNISYNLFVRLSTTIR